MIRKCGIVFDLFHMIKLSNGGSYEFAPAAYNISLGKRRGLLQGSIMMSTYHVKAKNGVI
jgi:hypothetical protein